MHRYELDRTSKKVLCPQCEKKSFVLYKDTKKNELIEEKHGVGKCDRIEKCGHHSTPKDSGYAKHVYQLEKGQEGEYKPKRNIIRAPKKAYKTKKVYCPDKVLEWTWNNNYQNNQFVNNLLRITPSVHDKLRVCAAVELYKCGTISGGFYDGAITFPFIDEDLRTHSIQIKHLDSENSTRKHENGRKMESWVHVELLKRYKALNKPVPKDIQEFADYKETKIECFFGAHLLKLFPDNPIGIVESSKAAIYATIENGHPAKSKNNILWLSSFNVSGLSMAKFKPLKGRTIVLYPDCSHPCKLKGTTTMEKWQQKAKEVEGKYPTISISVHEGMQHKATDEQKTEGYDIADLLYNKWRSKQHEKVQSSIRK